MEKTFESLMDYNVIKAINPKETNSEYSLEGLMLKLQYFGREPTHQKRPLCCKGLKAGGKEEDRG